MSHHPARRWRRCAIVLLAVALTGCAGTMRRSPVDRLVEPAGGVALADLVVTYDRASRNAWIELNVIRINQEFDDYKRELQAWRTTGNLAASTVGLLANIASSLTLSAGVKANYVALNSLATGLDGMADKEQFMEQTVHALIAAMEGRRAQAYTRLRIGMSRPEAEYNLADAHSDVLAFAAAGRLEEGMGFIVEATDQASIDAREDSREEIASIVRYSDEERQLTFCATESIDAVTPAQAAKLDLVLARLRVESPAGASLQAKKDLLKGVRLNAPASFQRDVSAALEAQGLLKSDCRRY